MEVLEREGRGCALVDSPSGLERLLAGGAHAIVANSGDESADKVVPYRNGGAEYIRKGQGAKRGNREQGRLQMGWDVEGSASVLLARGNRSAGQRARGLGVSREVLCSDEAGA